MAGKTKVNGVAYTVKKGSTKIGGTSKQIKKGITKIGGTAKTIKFSDLPDGYTPVEYLQSDGNQFINTGLNVSSIEGQETGWKFEGSMINYDTSYEAYVPLIAFYWKGGGYVSGVYATNQYTVYNIRGPIGTSTSPVSVNLPNPNTFFTGSFNYKNDNAFKINDSAVFSFGVPYRVDPGIPLILLQYVYIDTPKRNAVMKLKSFQISKGTTIIRDCYACYRDSDHKPGFIDKLTKTFYVNSGSGGDFVTGN